MQSALLTMFRDFLCIIYSTLIRQTDSTSKLITIKSKSNIGNGFNNIINKLILVINVGNTSDRANDCYYTLRFEVDKLIQY